MLDVIISQVLVDGEKACLDILDTAGQEEFSTLSDQWISTNEGFLLVYSITSASSFEEIKTSYDKILRIKNVTRVPCVLVGNKCDLEAQRQVTVEKGGELAAHIRCPFYETSAKMKINNELCYFDLVREVRRYHGPRKKVEKRSWCTIL